MVIEESDIQAAATLLRSSERGRAAMRDLLFLLDNGGISLDGSNQQALMTLIVASFTRFPGAARDAMRGASGIDPVAGRRAAIFREGQE